MKDLFYELQSANKAVRLETISYSPNHIHKYCAFTTSGKLLSAETFSGLVEEFAEFSEADHVLRELVIAENRANELREKLGGYE